MIDQLDIPDEIMEKIPTQVASGWKGIDPLDTYLSGSFYSMKLTDDEAEKIIIQFQKKNEFNIPVGLIKSFQRKKDIEYKLCPKHTFILAVIQGLRNRGFDVST